MPQRGAKAAEARAIILTLHDDCMLSDGAIARACNCSRYAVLQIRNGRGAYSGRNLLPRLRALAAAQGLSDIPAEGQVDAAGYDTPPAIAAELHGEPYAAAAYAPVAPAPLRAPRPQAPRQTIAYNTTAADAEDATDNGPGWVRVGPLRMRWRSGAGGGSSSKRPSSPRPAQRPRRRPGRPPATTWVEQLGAVTAPLLEQIAARSDSSGRHQGPPAPPTPPAPPRAPSAARAVQTAAAYLAGVVPRGWMMRPAQDSAMGQLTITCAVCGRSRPLGDAVTMVQTATGRRLVTCATSGCVRSVATL